MRDLTTIVSIVLAVGCYAFAAAWLTFFPVIGILWTLGWLS